MNTKKIVGIIICLVAAGIIFFSKDEVVVPVVITIGIIGITLIATSKKKK